MQSLKWYSGASRNVLLLVMAVSMIAIILFGSLAIDSGSLWHYLLAFIAFYFLIDSTSKVIKSTFINEHAPKTTNRRKSRKTA